VDSRVVLDAVVRRKPLPLAGNRTQTFQYVAHRYRLDDRGATNKRFCLVAVFSYTEYGGNTFLRNVCSYNTHRAPHLRRRHSSMSKFMNGDSSRLT
jgi:hypothetical protein